MQSPIRLTQYSQGAGCGCKVSPRVLDVILAGSGSQTADPRLLSLSAIGEMQTQKEFAVTVGRD